MISQCAFKTTATHLWHFTARWGSVTGRSDVTYVDMTCAERQERQAPRWLGGAATSPSPPPEPSCQSPSMSRRRNPAGHSLQSSLGGSLSVASVTTPCHQRRRPREGREGGEGGNRAGGDHSRRRNRPISQSWRISWLPDKRPSGVIGGNQSRPVPAAASRE